MVSLGPAWAPQNELVLKKKKIKEKKNSTKQQNDI